MTHDGTEAATVRVVVHRFGGRYSSELGIDLDAGDEAVERWFLAATLFGGRIAAPVAARTFEQLARAGVMRITDAGTRDGSELVALLDAGGYARYDVRTAARLQDLARVVTERYGGDVGEIGRRYEDPQALAAALDDLPGWGPVTVGLFLRELRDTWPGARVPLDERAAWSARHLGLLPAQGGRELERLAEMANEAGCDPRDLEAALVRTSLAHRRVTGCPGGRHCALIDEEP